MRRFSEWFMANACALGSMTLLIGCSDLGNCSDGRPDIVVDSGVTDQDARTYQSTPAWGPRTEFPAKTTLHCRHDLGFVPEIMQSFVSFTAENSGVSENAGNQGIWKCVDDHELV